jgi:maltose-binding protein MalE
MVDVIWYDEFIKAGYLADVTNRVTADEKQNIFPTAWNVVTRDNKAYGMPWLLETKYLYYNQDLLKQAGFDNPPATWEELLTQAKAIKDKGLAILFRIIMPISTPGLVSTALFIFLVAWDEFFFALIFTNTLAAKTAPVAISEFVGRYVTDINAMMAGGMLVALPPVLLAIIFQRFIVSGLSAGAVKG